MKVLILPTLVLGVACFFETQAAQATSVDQTSPYFHLTRGGGHGGHGEFRGEEGRRSEGSHGLNNDRGSAADANIAKDHATTPADRLHTLDNARNNENWAGYGDGFGDAAVGDVGPCWTDANGNQICGSPNISN